MVRIYIMGYMTLLSFWYHLLPFFYIQFIVPWARGYPFPCQKETGTAQWIARHWWGCDDNGTQKNEHGYYFLPDVPANKLVGQRMKDALHTVFFVIGGFIGAYSGQFWYKCLSRLV